MNLFNFLLTLVAIILMTFPLGLMAFRWEIQRWPILRFPVKSGWSLYAVLYLIMCIMFQVAGLSILCLILSYKP